jgi:hypothetical protein
MVKAVAWERKRAVATYFMAVVVETRSDSGFSDLWDVQI